MSIPFASLKKVLRDMRKSGATTCRVREPLTCPFCGLHPFEYVDNGIGMEAIAVNCCEYGASYFDHRIETPLRVQRIGDLLSGDQRQKRRGTRLLKRLEDEMEVYA